MENKKNLPCGKNNCIFTDCINIADGNDGVVCDVVPCAAFGDCPNRFGVKN